MLEGLGWNVPCHPRSVNVECAHFTCLTIIGVKHAQVGKVRVLTTTETGDPRCTGTGRGGARTLSSGL